MIFFWPILESSSPALSERAVSTTMAERKRFAVASDDLASVALCVDREGDASRRAVLSPPGGGGPQISSSRSPEPCKRAPRLLGRLWATPPPRIPEGRGGCERNDSSDKCRLEKRILGGKCSQTLSSESTRAREEDLPECKPWAVCSKVDLYEAPWVERQCRCPGRQACSGLLSAADGHTLTDRTRHLKRRREARATTEEEARVRQWERAFYERRQRGGSSDHSSSHVGDSDRVENGEQPLRRAEWKRRNGVHEELRRGAGNGGGSGTVRGRSRSAACEKRRAIEPGGMFALRRRTVLRQIPLNPARRSHPSQSHSGATTTTALPHWRRRRPAAQQQQHQMAGGAAALCEPIKKLPKCRFFRDVTWTLKSAPNNATEQLVNCHCPKGAVAYLIKRQPHSQGGAQGFIYSFACSPQSRLRCQRKEPCRLFTVRKRPELLDEVNTNTLCQCPHGHTCPRHHTEPGVIPGSSYADEEPIRTFSGYCLSPALRAAAAAASPSTPPSGPSH
ncbi:Protein giant-lens [Gryllus bimaculatus]|nr:Protein giant-lens [Gryllus bimaculatus]